MNSTKRSLALIGFAGFSFFFAFNQFILLPLYLEQLGMGSGEIGVVLSALFLSAVISRPIIGVVAARVGGRRLALIGSALWIVMAPTYLLLTPGTVWAVYPLRLLQGIAYAAVDLVLAVVPAELGSEGQRAQRMGIVSIAFVVGYATSPAVAEWLLNHSGFSALFLVSLFFGMGTFVALLALKLPLISRPSQPFRMNLLGNWKHTVTRDLIFLLLTTFLAMGLVGGAYSTFIPLYAKSRSAGAGSVFFLFNSISSVAMRVLFSGLSDRIGRRKVIAPAFLFGIAALVLLFDLRSAVIVALAGFLFGLQEGFQIPALMALVVDTQSRDADPSLAMGLFLTTYDAGMWMGASVFGYVAEVIGFGPAFLGLAIFNLLGAGLITQVRPVRSRAVLDVSTAEMGKTV